VQIVTKISQTNAGFSSPKNHVVFTRAVSQREKMEIGTIRNLNLIFSPLAGARTMEIGLIRNQNLIFLPEIGHYSTSFALSFFHTSAAAANAQWPTDGYKSDDCLKVSNRMQTTPATPASLPPLPQNLFLAPILDSGRTIHLTGHLQLLHKFAPHLKRSISVANNNSVMSYSSGIICGHIVID